MKNTANYQVDLFRFLAMCIDMRYRQEVCLEEIMVLIG